MGEGRWRQGTEVNQLSKENDIISLCTTVSTMTVLMISQNLEDLSLRFNIFPGKFTITWFHSELSHREFESCLLNCLQCVHVTQLSGLFIYNCFFVFTVRRTPTLVTCLLLMSWSSVQSSYVFLTAAGLAIPHLRLSLIR